MKFSYFALIILGTTMAAQADIAVTNLRAGASTQEITGTVTWTDNTYASNTDWFWKKEGTYTANRGELIDRSGAISTDPLTLEPVTDNNLQAIANGTYNVYYFHYDGDTNHKESSLQINLTDEYIVGLVIDNNSIRNKTLLQWNNLGSLATSDIYGTTSTGPNDNGNGLQVNEDYKLFNAVDIDGTDYATSFELLAQKNGTTAGDTFRVVTAAIPEPATITFIVLIGSSMLVIRRIFDL